MKASSPPPTDLDTIAEKIGLSEASVEEEQPQEDLLHDDGLRFFESPPFTSTEERYQQALEIARGLFASMKPKRHYRGIEYEQLCEMLALELLLPTEEFHQATYQSLSIEGIMEIARRYEVSYRLVAKRLMAYPYVGVFEADAHFVSWAYGGIRSGLLDNLDPDLRSVIQYALEHEYKEPVRFFSPRKPWFGSRCIEWARLPRGKTLFLVRLPRRNETFNPDLDFTQELVANYA